MALSFKALVLYTVVWLPTGESLHARTIDVLSKSELGPVKKPIADALTDPTESEKAHMVAARHAYYKNLTIMTYEEHDSISLAIQKTGLWEDDHVRMFCDAFKENGGRGHFLDVGANIGAYSLTLATCARENGLKGGGEVFAVEANPNNLKHLRASIRRNNMKNLRLYGYAVGTPTGPDEVHFSDWKSGNHGMGLVWPRATNHTVVVPATTLDAIMDQESKMKHIFAMKMDIEGYEFFAMQGAERFFTQNPPCIVTYEFGEGGSRNATCGGFLAQHGYTYAGAVDYVSPGQPKDVRWVQTDMKGCVARL